VVLEDKFSGALLGFSVGDVVGSPYEGLSAFDIKDKWKIGEGSITDDTELMLSTSESLIECGCIDPVDMARRLVDSFDEGKLKRIGSRVKHAIENLKRGVLPAKSGAKGQWASGSGGILRSVAVALFMFGCDEKKVKSGIRYTVMITHNNEDAIEGAYVFSKILHLLLRGEDVRRGIERVVEGIRSVRLKEEIKRRLALLETASELVDVLPGIGVKSDVYSVLGNAICCFLRHYTSFEDSIRCSILIGGDTDTTAAVVGAFWGALNGASKIPLEYKVVLGDLEERIIQIATSLYKRRMCR